MKYADLIQEFHSQLSKEWSSKNVELLIKSIWKLCKNTEVDKHTQVDETLKLINQILNGYGIESVRGKLWISYVYQDINLLYVNMGDTYAITILFDTFTMKFIFSSVGDYIETHSKRFEI